MSKRNFTLLILALLVIGIIVFLFFLFYKSPKVPTSNGSGTNTFGNFGPGGQTSPNQTPPANISGYVPPAGDTTVIKLRKVSSMPIAGFGVFSKERFVEVPAVTPPSSGTGTTDSGTSASDTSTDTDNSAPETPPAKPAPATKQTPAAPATEFATAVRYVARATGNVYETFADTINEQKFTSTIIPEVYDAHFGNNAQSVVMRYLNSDNTTIETFTGSMPPETLTGDSTEDNEIKGSFLPEGITDLSVSPDMMKLFYLFNIEGTDTDTVSGVVSGILGDAKTPVFNSPFTEWLTQWPTSSMITVTSKPASGVLGYMYAINPAKKDFEEILGDVNGLTTLTSPDGKLVLYSDDNLNLSLYNIANKSTIRLPWQTMAEKCVWNKTSTSLYCAVPRSVPQTPYPDSWYMGAVSFSDQIWKLDLTTQTPTMLVDPVTVPGGEDIDAINLALDAKENYLFFINKKDSFLWELDLSGQQ